MRRYRQTARFDESGDRLRARVCPFKIRQHGSDTEKMAFCRGDFDSRNNQKIVHRHSIFPHKALVQQVRDRVAGIVIGHHKRVEALLAGGLDKLFRTADPVARKERMAMEVNLHRHELQIIEEMKRAN